MTLLDEINVDVENTRAEMHDAAERLEHAAFDIFRNEDVEDDAEADAMLKNLKDIQKEFNGRVKAYETAVKNYRDFFIGEK